MQLSPKILSSIHVKKLSLPDPGVWVLPEKILQFGTGVLLRGLPDYFIDKANKQQLFNGRIVVVKSTALGDTDAYQQQNCLYTHVERGLANGKNIEKISINASISRVLSAKDDWEAILACAANPHLQIILSNTTEMGIQLDESDITRQQPESFPGRLLAFLLARYQAFGGDKEAGMVIIPTELIPDNGKCLQEIVVTLANQKKLPAAFINWLTDANDFCNSLVDRIVPGKLSEAEQELMEKKLGYSDRLMIMSETYRLWAIEVTRKRSRDILAFSKADPGIFLSADINKFREIKLRLLNGTHTLSCGLAFLSGFVTVKEAMADQLFAQFVATLLTKEIAPLVIKDTISKEEIGLFIAQLKDRFSNPNIAHKWLSITVQYTSKLITRVVPLVEKNYTLAAQPPRLMALGLAAFILFMRVVKENDGVYYGNSNGIAYPVQEDKAALLAAKWENEDTGSLVDSILSDEQLFGKNLAVYPGFSATVNEYLSRMMQMGVRETLASVM